MRQDCVKTEQVNMVKVLKLSTVLHDKQNLIHRFDKLMLTITANLTDVSYCVKKQAHQWLI